MSKEELIEEILDIIHSENSGLSIHQRVSEIEKILNQNKDNKEVLPKEFVIGTKTIEDE